MKTERLIDHLIDHLIDPSLFINVGMTTFRGCSFNQLPKDMKRYLSYFLEPIHAYEICKDIGCNWKKMLDLNYDFVTQGFAIGDTDQEKFQYLAERVSKNVEVEYPEKVFFHVGGIPIDDDVDSYKHGSKNIVSWHDKYNTWCKNYDVDTSIFDIPSDRNEMMKKKGLNWKDETINVEKMRKNLRGSLTEDVGDFDDDLLLNNEFIGYVLYEEFNSMTYNYGIYTLMIDFYLSKGEAKILLDIVLKNRKSIEDNTFKILDEFN